MLVLLLLLSFAVKELWKEGASTIEQNVIEFSFIPHSVNTLAKEAAIGRVAEWKRCDEKLNFLYLELISINKV